MTVATSGGAGLRARHAGRPVTLYLVLAFGLSWWPWPLVLLNPASVPIVPFGPAIAAAVTLAIVGQGTLAELVRSLVRWRIDGRYWLVAFVLPLAMTIGAGIGLTMSGASLALPAGTQVLGIAVGGIGAAVVGGPLTEEPGWRGTMLPLTERRRGWAAASLLVAGAWIVWHLPLFVSSATNQRDPVPFALMLLAISPVLAWLWVGSRSLLLVVTAHALVNTSTGVLLQASSVMGAAWWATAVAWLLPGAVALALLARPSTAPLARYNPAEVS